MDAGFVFVTNNRVDFLKLYKREELHGGLVCLNAAYKAMDGEQQRRLFTLALARLGRQEPYNDVLEITLAEDGTVAVDRYPHPEAS